MQDSRTYNLKSLLHGIGAGGTVTGHGTVTFGEDVNFTVNAGTDKDNASPMNTGDYATDHSAKYVKIEKTPDPV